MSTSAIVVGASIAGLSTARVLSDHVDRVEIVERDVLALTPEPRRGVPQGRHAHAVLAAGERLIDAWFPGIIEHLEAQGAVRTSGLDAWWHQGGAYKVRADWGGSAISASRPCLEMTVRQHLLRRPNVTIADGVSVDGLIVDDGRVNGVVIDGCELRSDLVVDCSGRHTRFLDQLDTVGFPMPEMSTVKIDMAYGTRILRRRSDDFDGAFGIVIGGPAHGHRLGVLLPLEGDRWILTLCGFHGDVPPTDDEGFRAFARSLPAPLLADVLDRAEPLSPVMSHRLPSSQRRHFEKLRRAPAGFAALGDAVCSFNPVYGQGMSSAALQAEALGVAIARHGVGSQPMVRDFYRRAAKVVTNPWTIAVGADFAHPKTSGPKPAGTDVVNRYIAKVQLATHVSPVVNTQMMKVQNLLAAPQSMMKPSMVLRVLAAARRSPVVTSVATAQPALGVALRASA
jgi:2-polyprenyl-6-methoxyphenol hydroxylase-like FAD-dependent oxidoreductase